MEGLKVIESKDVVKNALEEVELRRSGNKALGLKTRWNKLNKQMSGGFQWGYNYLIAGLSGSGKSTLANIIETDIIDLNPEQEFIVLNFNFETDSTMNMIKKFSADTSMTVSELMSTEKPVTDIQYEMIKEKAKRFEKYRIFYFDVSGNCTEIAYTIAHYHKTYNLPMFCILDHTGLVSPQNRQSELEMVTELSKLTIRIKKTLPVSFLMLGQLNSEIEREARITNPSLHKPMRSDLFGGKSVYNAMDFICMPHRPELLGITKYTTQEFDTAGKMFFHIVKQRFGAVGTIIMDSTKIGQNIIEEI